MPPATENIPAIDPATGLSTTEFALMLAGKPYLASDPYRCLIANQVTKDLYDFNQERSMAKRCEILQTFFRNGSDVERPRRLISLPFFCEYVSGFAVKKEGSEGVDGSLVLRGSTLRWAMGFISARTAPSWMSVLVRLPASVQKSYTNQTLPPQSPSVAAPCSAPT